MRLLKAIVTIARPHQWTKNLFIFAALVFSQNLFDISKFLTTLLAFFSFCFVASFVYIINDIKDLEHDKNHPRKKNRPLPAGDLSVKTAAISSIFFLLAGLGSAFMINIDFTLVLLIYILLNVLYSFKLKEIAIIDILLVSSGFLLRVISGALAINVGISSWLLMCAALLALLLVLGKRRQEVKKYKDLEKNSPISENYSLSFLDQMINAITASTLTAYLLYTFSGKTIQKFGSRSLALTVPFVFYGIFRYLYLLHETDIAETPEKIVLTDSFFLINLLSWILVTFLVIYF